MIQNERDCRHEHVLGVARQMMTAARTAPKGKGVDVIEAALVTGEDLKKLSEKMKEAGKTDILIMSAGPYKHNSCMSAYCVNAQKMADAVNMLCWTDDGKIRYFSQILFRE